MPFLDMTNKASPMRARQARPPMTPPTMAPTLVPPPLVSAALLLAAHAVPPIVDDQTPPPRQARVGDPVYPMLQTPDAVVRAAMGLQVASPVAESAGHWAPAAAHPQGRGKGTEGANKRK